MTTLLAILLLLAAPGQTAGPAGAQRTLATSSSEVTSAVRAGIVLDATAGQPVVGATVEAWTEDIDGAAGGRRRVGSAATRPDGTFELRVADGPIRADKLLVRRSDYLTWAGTLDEIELVRLQPRPPWTVVVRVTDLLDRPIAGAHVTSTYSCTHDVPAVDVHTDADGIARLAGWGLQDHVGELRVRAAGFLGRKYVPWSKVAPSPDGTPATLRLAREPGWRGRVLSHDGEPLADTVLRLQDGEGHHVCRTDASGAFEVPSPFCGGEVSIFVLQPEQDTYVTACAPPPGREVALRVGADEWPDALPTGTIELPWAPNVRMSLFHEDGWAEVRAGAFPAGRVLARIGAPFSGWEEDVVELELGAGEHVELPLREEPLLTILTPPGDAARILVQAGERSVELEGDAHVTTPVPRGRELVVYSEGRTTRRAVVPPLDADRTVDLRDDAHLLPPTRAQEIATAPRVLLPVEITNGIGSELTVRGAGSPSVERVAPGRFTVDAPASYPVLLTFRAKDRAPRTTTVLAGPDPVTLRLSPSSDPSAGD